MKIKIFISQVIEATVPRLSILHKTTGIVVSGYQISIVMKSLNKFCLLFTEIFTIIYM